MRQPIRVMSGSGGEINFDNPNMGRPFKGVPAYVVNIREWHQEDRTSFTPAGGESDEYILNSQVTEQSLRIEWHLGDEGKIKEIGFLCVGESDQD